jgi:hypothetical protein
MSVDLWQLMADVTMKKWIFHHQKWWLFMVILWMGLFETLHQLKTDGGKHPTILFGFQPTFLWRRISQPSTEWLMSSHYFCWDVFGCATAPRKNTNLGQVYTMRT